MPQYKCKNIAALDIVLGGLPAKMRVEADVGTGDLRIYFEYGLLRPGCRRLDIADLAELGIFDDKNAALPWAELHPYAISTVADLLRAVGGGRQEAYEFSLMVE
jgi:hypothetical protein